MVKFIYKNYNWFHNQILDFYCYITNTRVNTYTNKPSLDGCRGRTLEWASSLLEENLWPFFFFWLAGQDGQNSDGDAVIIKSFRGPCKIKGTAENLNFMYVKCAPLPPFLILLPGIVQLMNSQHFMNKIMERNNWKHTPFPVGSLAKASGLSVNISKRDKCCLQLFTVIGNQSWRIFLSSPFGETHYFPSRVGGPWSYSIQIFQFFLPQFFNEHLSIQIN